MWRGQGRGDTPEARGEDVARSILVNPWNRVPVGPDHVQGHTPDLRLTPPDIRESTGIVAYYDRANIQGETAEYPLTAEEMESYLAWRQGQEY